MKLIVLIALGTLATANAGKNEELVPNYMYFPDGDGIPHLIDLAEEGVDLTGYDSGNPILARNVESITFNLFTIDNPTTPQVLILDSITSVTESNWKSSRQTRFFAHGWLSSQESEACKVVRDAYIAAGDYNVIVVDWSPIAKTDYINAANSVRGVAARIGLLIDFLNKNAGLDLQRTTVVGHSLGGHVAGLAARFATGTVDSVISLDPAMPLFLTKKPGYRVDSTDANHVQVIHTNGGFLGMTMGLGHTDFYPNGGSRQPGCGLDLIGICSHARAYHFLVEAIANPTGFRATSQSSRLPKATDQSSEVYMGTIDKGITGSFSLNTAAESPFALG